MSTTHQVYGRALQAEGTACTKAPKAGRCPEKNPACRLASREMAPYLAVSKAGCPGEG